MKLYCLVQNNTVVQGPMLLPGHLANKSDFELLNLGWYFSERVGPPTFNDRYETWLPIHFDIQTNKVICTWTKRDKTQEELNTQNFIKQQQVEMEKSNRIQFAQEFMQSPAFAALHEDLQAEWNAYLPELTNTVTSGLGDAIWDFFLPSQPRTTNEPEPLPG